MKRPLVKAFHWAMPLIRYLCLDELVIDFHPSDLERLRHLPGKRTLLLPNHPTEEDPYVLFELSRALNEAFHFVAAREAFDWNGGLRGKLFQSMGVYSVVRGMPDRDSFRQTRQCLTDGQHRLVVFIEGEISYENDTLFPFEAGVVHLAFRAQEDLAKRNADTAEREGVHVAPLALRYRYKAGVETAIFEAVSALEHALNIESGARAVVARIRTIGEAVLATHEKRLNIEHDRRQGFQSIQARIDIVKSRILDRMEETLGLHANIDLPVLDRIRAIRNKMDQMVHHYERGEGNGNDPPTAYEERVLKDERPIMQEFYKELDRLLNFLTLRQDYLTDDSTPERLMEVIRRLEREVYGKAKVNYPRVAKVRLGTVHPLQAHMPAYQDDHRSTARQMARQMEAEVASLLATL